MALQKKFKVVGNSGDTTVEGSATVTGPVTATSGGVTGQAMSAQNGLTVTSAEGHISGQNLKALQCGASSIFSVASASGNTNVVGTMTAAALASFQGGMEVIGAETHVNGQSLRL